MNKKLIWLISVLIAIIVVALVLKKMHIIGGVEGLKVATEKAGMRTISEIVTASGKIYPEVEVKVSPDISGEIVELNVAEGDSVRKGQVLARIYADIYSSQRDQAAAVVTQSQAQVANSTEQLAALKATLDQAESAYNRQKKLLDDKVISQSEFEQAQQAVRSARAQYNAALQGIKGTEASVQSARAQLSRANKDVSRATLVAPMDGIVSLLAVKKGERVVGTAQMAGTEMLRVADMSVMEVRVNVGENDIPKVKLGDTAIVNVDAYSNSKFKGIVTKIASSSTTAGSNSGATSDVTNYEVNVRLLPESYKNLQTGKTSPFRPGMNASVDIQTLTHNNVLSVPINAVTTRALEPATGNTDKSVNANANNSSSIDEVVFVVNPDKKTVKQVKVSTAIQDINYIEITSGLKAGDEVVSAPYSAVSKQLNNGDKIAIVPKEQLFELLE